MTFQVRDRIYETSTTAGVGTLTLAGAQTGFQPLSVIGANNQCTYFLTDDTNWEVGIGTYLSGPNRLQRDTILASSNAGAAVNWGGGTIKVRVGVPAAGILPVRRLSKAVGGGAGTTVLTQDEQRRSVLEFTGVLTGNRILEVDATEWTWPAVYNNTSGAFTLTLRVTGQTGVVVPQKRAMALHCDGTDVRRRGDASALETRSSNTILGAGDFGKSFTATGTFTQTFDAAATLGDAWFVMYRNSGTGVVTFDANGAETIDGRQSIQLHPGESCVIACNGTALFTYGRGASQVPQIVRGYLHGLTMSNNGADAVNDIDIAAGVAVDGTNVEIMTLGATLTKRLDAAWAVGSGNGGLDTGAIADTTYHVWLIKRSDTGVVDALFSTSASAPTMPANYDYKRRIGSILREAAAIVGFVQDGDYFARKGSVLDVSVTNPGVAAVSRTLSVPAGINVFAMLNAVVQDASQSGSLYLSDLDVNDAAASVTAAPLSQIFYINTASTGGAWSGKIRTNTSRQIRSRLAASGASTVLRIATLGWIDLRGKED